MEKKVRILAGILTAAFLVCVIFPDYGVMANGKMSQIEGIHFYTEGWHIVEDGAWTEIELPFRSPVPANQEITFAHRTGREEWGKWLCVPTTNQLFSVYADDKLIYERETRATRKNANAPTKGFNYIEIPEGTETIFFVLSSPYLYGGGELSSVYIGDSESRLIYLNYIIYEFNYFMSALLVFMGGFAVAYGCYLLLVRERAGIMLNMGMLASLIGIWFSYGTMCIEKSLLPRRLQEGIAHVAWFLIPIFLCGFLSCYFESRKKKYLWMALIFFVNMASAFWLAAAGIFELAETSFATGLFELAVLMVAVYDALTYMRREKLQDKKMGLVGFGVFGVLTIVELMVYYFSVIPSGAFVRFGIVCWLLFLGAEELYRKEKQKQEFYKNMAEDRKRQLFVALRQLQPQFIFNALDATRQMIHTDSDMAYDMLYDFSRFLGASYRGLKDKMIPFLQELEQIQAYLNIEEKRHRVKGQYEIETDSFLIPTLTIEPLVMAAAQRALRSDGEMGTVTVRTYKKGKTVVVEIVDDGIGYDSNLMSCGQTDDVVGDWADIGPEADSYMSMAGISGRLKAQVKASVSVESGEGKGTTVHIEI